MARSSKSQEHHDDKSELTAAVQRLTDVIQVLTDTVGDLTQEVQWQNNERSHSRDAEHLPLTKMPLDPTTRDWHPTFGRDRPSSDQPTTPETLLKPPETPPLDLARQSYVKLEALWEEIARVEQIAALLVITVSSESSEEVPAEWDRLVEWAFEWFDGDMLRESLSESGASPGEQIAPDVKDPVKSDRSPTERQHALFSADEVQEAKKPPATPPSD